MNKDYQIKHALLPRRPAVPIRVASLHQSKGGQAGGIEVASNDDAEKRFWGKFLLERVIGKGGYGIVMLVKDRFSGQHAAIKTIDKEKVSEEVLERLRQEPKLLAKLDKSKYIVKSLESFESKKRIFLLMEYMKGGDLSQYIKKRRSENSSFRESEVCTIVAGLLRALKCIHGNQIIHGDIKPGRLHSRSKRFAQRGGKIRSAQGGGFRLQYLQRKKQWAGK